MVVWTEWNTSLNLETEPLDSPFMISPTASSDKHQLEQYFSLKRSMLSWKKEKIALDFGCTIFAKPCDYRLECTDYVMGHLKHDYYLLKCFQSFKWILDPVLEFLSTKKRSDARSMILVTTLTVDIRLPLFDLLNGEMGPVLEFHHDTCLKVH